jgi:uncharacterized membrane protein YdbT with pleckstrin-like domain
MPDLLPGEAVLLATRRHLIVLLVPLFLALVSALLVLTQACPMALDLQLDGRCPLVVGVFLFGVAALSLLDWLTTRFILTDQRLLLVQRPLWLRTRSLQLSAIAGLTLREGLLGRLLGLGEVVVDTAATRGGRLVLDFVPDPETVRDRLAAAIEAHAWR